MSFSTRYRSARSLCGLLMVLVGVVFLSTRSRVGPFCGIHTVRADDEALSLICESGCSWVVQLFDWSQIEPLPAEYFWEYPDSVVRACQHYRLNLAVRLDHPPDWALCSVEDELPIDKDAYAGFVARVAERYRGKVQAYIVWNEPNLAREWNNRPPNPGAYTELLQAAYPSIKKGDAHALVVSAGLAPTNLVDRTAMDDRAYLQGMYDAGAKDAFDILGAHPYGFAYPPEDSHDAHRGLNFARLMDLRSIMVERGDAHKAIWVTELGWTTAAVDQEQAWLEVSEEQQAAYLKGAFEIARKEWPWLEMMAVWNLSAGLPADDEKRGYSIVNDEYVPRPAYLAVADVPKTGGQVEVTYSQRADRAVQILARDVVIRLGDVDTLYPHWARIYAGQAPSLNWAGDFYVERPGGTLWRLTMEIMQVEEQGNRVTINGQPVMPMTIPLRGKLDFASSWTVASLTVPPQLVRRGVNVIEIEASPRWPVYQDGSARFESLQFRNLRLVPVPRL